LLAGIPRNPLCSVFPVVWAVTYTLHLENETKMFLVISSAKLGRFCSNLLHSFLNKCHAKSCLRFSSRLSMSVHYLAKLEICVGGIVAYPRVSRPVVDILSSKHRRPDLLIA